MVFGVVGATAFSAGVIVASVGMILFDGGARRPSPGD